MSKRTLYNYFSASAGPTSSSCTGITVSKPDGHETSSTKSTSVAAKAPPGAKRLRSVGRPHKKKPVIIDLTSSDAEVADSAASKTTQVAGASERGSAGSPVKKIRQLYSHSQKARIATYARHHGARAAARHFGVHHRNTQRWLKEEMDKVKNKGKPRKHRKGQGRKISYPSDTEEKLVEWILEKRDQLNVPVSTQMIRLKALSLVKPVLPGFKASDGWLRKFLARNNLVLRAKTSIAQTLPHDLEDKIPQFRQRVNYVRQNGDFPYELIANMDETPVYFDMVPSKTVDRKGKKSITVRTTKGEKKRITAVLTCTASGDLLPPMIIFKGTTRRSIRNVSSKGEAVIEFQKKAWMNEKLMIEWIKKIWVVYTKGRPSLLILDCFTAHLTEAVQDLFTQHNTTVIVIPGGCTSVLQPLDVSINKPVKGILRHLWEQYMLEQSDTDSGKQGKFSQPTKQHIVDWVAEANQNFNSNAAIVKKSFLVTGISNSLGGHEDHLVRNESIRQEIEEIITEVFGDESMGFKPSEELADDPFTSDSDISSSAGLDSQPEDASSVEDDSSITAPEFEPLDSDCLSD